MKCEGCEANLSYASNLDLTLNFLGKIVIQCPACNYVMVVIYNPRRQIWETEKQRDERRAGWKRGG